MIQTDFAPLVRSIPYRHRGVYPSEMCMFLQLCEKHAVNRIIESGIRNGYSTTVLAAAGFGPVTSIDWRHINLEPPAGVTFHKGDAFELVPMLLKQHAADRIAVLLDGPKGERARLLKAICLTCSCVQFVACHDQSPGFGETLHSSHVGDRSLDSDIPSEWHKWPNGPGLSVWVLP